MTNTPIPNQGPAPTNTVQSLSEAQNKPVQYIPPDMSIFDNIETQNSIRAKKAGYLAELAMNSIFATLKSYCPEEGKATDINKLAGAIKLLADLEAQYKPGSEADTRKVKDITAEMGRILGVDKKPTTKPKS